MLKGKPFNSIVIPILGFTASGGNRVLSNLADHWIGMGLNVDFLVQNESKPYFPTMARIFNCTKGKLKSRNFGGLMQKIDVVTNIFCLAKELRKAAGTYDLVVASHSFTAIACYLSGCTAKTIYYIQAYDPEVLQKKSSLSSWFAARIAQMSYILCQNHIVNSSHYLNYKQVNASYVVPPGVDLNTFIAKENPGEIGGEVIKVGMIGRRELYKVRPVLEAYRSLRSVQQNTKLFIAFGNLEPAMLDGLGDFEMIFPQNDLELAAFYRSCHIFLALSEFTFGAYYPALEALASGTSLVSNGFDNVTSENSWIIESTADTNRIFRHLLSQSIQRTDKARRGVQDISELSWDIVAPSFLKCARQILDGR